MDEREISTVCKTSINLELHFAQYETTNQNNNKIKSHAYDNSSINK